MKLGKLAAKWHPKTLRFSQFASADLVLPDPSKVYWGYKVTDWKMLGNGPDTLNGLPFAGAGNCVVAGLLHWLMNLSAHTGTAKTYTTEQAIDLYITLTGLAGAAYNPETGENDNGLVVTDALEYARTVGIFGDKILGWVAFDHSNRAHFDAVDFMFGGVGVGQQVSDTDQEQFSEGQPFSLVPNSTIEGGHFTPYFNYGSAGRKMVTWAQLQAALASWIDNRVDESYGIITTDWFDTQSKLAPSGFNVDQLWAAVKLLSA